MHHPLGSFLESCSHSGSIPSSISTATQPSFQGSVRSSSNEIPLALAAFPESKDCPGFPRNDLPCLQRQPFCAYSTPEPRYRRLPIRSASSDVPFRSLGYLRAGTIAGHVLFRFPMLQLNPATMHHARAHLCSWRNDKPLFGTRRTLTQDGLFSGLVATSITLCCMFCSFSAFGQANCEQKR